MKKSDVLRELIKNLKDHVDPLDKPKMRIFISDELSLRVVPTISPAVGQMGFTATLNFGRQKSSK